ncbi:MAG: hypothetical protein FWG31_08390 [Oscillospiraceae bacterium]|nr:hypothetical protein [Oscillospiraceae bacterium]
MNVASISGAGAVHTASQLQAREQTSQVLAAPEQANGRKADTVEISSSRANRSGMQRDNAVRTVNMQAQMLRRMAERIIKEQYSKGNHLFMLLYGNKALELDPTLRPDGMKVELADPQQQAAVANAVEYFSPPSTASRILDVAEDVAGGVDVLTGNPAMIDIFRNAVGAAFLAVQTEAGGNLPDRTQRTYEIAMQGFSDWKAAANEFSE